MPKVDDEVAIKTTMDGLRKGPELNVFEEIDKNVLVTIAFNVQMCHSKKPKQNSLLTCLIFELTSLQQQSLSGKPFQAFMLVC